MKKKVLVIFTSITLILFSCLFIGCKNKCKNNEENNVVIKFISEGNQILEKTVVKGYTLVESDFPSDPIKDGYDFVGWYVDLLKISAGYDVDTNTTIVAKFVESSKQEVKQDGTKEYPYLISNADDLINFADRLNHMDEETADINYYKAYFALNNDIDMTGKNYTPAGKEIVREIDGVEETIYGFMGNLDGRGHKISNLTLNINMKTNRVYYLGLFGIVKFANIENLTLDNINYSVESGSDDASRSIIVGGIAGNAQLSNFENVEVNGVINTSIFESNGAYIGGIAGEWDVRDSEKSYIAYTRNCYVNVETKIGEVDGEVCSLESASNGGLFGYVNNSGSSVAVINCITEGKVYGGQYVGGLIGYCSSDNVSILDSGSYSTVYATANDVSYTGGLVGMTRGDTIIKDSFFFGPVVRGTRAGSSMYQSFAGGIVGYGIEDDYEQYYTAGLVCVNTYYKTVVRGANKTTTYGISTDEELTLDFASDVLKWSINNWNFEDNKFIAKKLSIDNQEYKIKLIVNGVVVETLTREAKNGAYSLMGVLEDYKNVGSNVFYEWQLSDGVKYRYYMPITKDIEVNAKIYDVSEITGIYAGTGTLHETKDAGLIVLYENGSLQWINSSTVSGKYRYDGKHLLFEIYNNIGSVSGTLIDGNLTFIVNAGMSGDVTYNFSKSEKSLFGEYFSETGDIITFGSDGKLSYQSTNFRSGDYTNGTYTQEGNLLTVTGSNFSSTFSSMTIIDNGDLTLTVNFISKDSSVPSLENVTFSKILNKDYSKYHYANNTYRFAYVSGGSPVYQSEYDLKFNSDGTAEYISAYSTTMCEYYVFNNGKTIKLILEGYTSELTYDEEQNILYGILNRGNVFVKRGIVLVPSEEGTVYGLIIDDVSNILFATKTRSFLFVDGIYQKDAIIEIPSLDNNARISINNQAYIIIYQQSEHTTNKGYSLAKVGQEEGTYLYNGLSIKLDGIGNVTGDIQGSYKVFDNNLVVVLTNNDEFIGFNYEKAKDNDGNIEMIEANKYQGIWYSDYNNIKDYYKLLIDGYGHIAFMYKKINNETGEFIYTHNWGSENSWVNVVENAGVLSCDFNEYQHCEMRFYYDYNLMYSTNFGYMKTISMTKKGYSGSIVPPTLPSNVVGRYVGKDSNEIPVVLNIRQDLNGSYAGKPFVAIYDGNQTLTFKIDSKTYLFDIKTLVLTYENETIQLSSDGNIQEVIPESICGVWKGTNWNGMGSDNSTAITIEKDGTVKYVQQSFENVVFDYETMTITGTGKDSNQQDISIVITYNAETETIDVVYVFEYDDEAHTVIGKNLTKNK